VVTGGLTLFGPTLTINGSGGTVTAFFVPYPIVTFFENGCGPVTFNGTSYSSGWTGNFLPPEGPFSLAASTCSAYAFQEWDVSGGVTVADSTASVTTASLTGNATINAIYGSVGGGVVVSYFVVQPSVVPVGTPFSVSLSGSGPASPFNYSYTGLPSGCDAMFRSQFSCTPQVAGVYSIQGTIRDTAGATAQATTSLIVTSDAAGPLITAFIAFPSTLAVGGVFSLTVAVLNGAVPLAFSYSGLPPGCASSSVAQLDCTPQSAGNYTIRVEVLDAQNRGSQADVNVTVISGPPPAPAPLAGALVVLGWAIAAAAIAIVAVAAIVWARRRRRAPPTLP
jgi:hypothetical protein